MNTLIDIIGPTAYVYGDVDAKSMDLNDFMRRLTTNDTSNLILTDGVKHIHTTPCGNGIVVVHETPPRVHSMKWAAMKRGEAYEYTARTNQLGVAERRHRIALPYVILMPVIARHEFGAHGYGYTHTMCYFRNEPLTGLDDELFRPHLRNAASGDTGLSFLCQPFDRSGLYASDPCAVIAEVLRRLPSTFTTGFNGDISGNFFDRSPPPDPRLKHPDTWEAASLADPSFITKVNWHSPEIVYQQVGTINTLRKVMVVMNSRMGGMAASLEAHNHLDRIILNGR